MLTFLRKIRKSLIDSGSSRRYLFYAIGEIALVVIGILIALQINNWNQGQSNQKKLNSYLEALSMEIKINIEVLERAEQRAINDMEESLQILAIANSDSARSFTSDDFVKLNLGPINKRELFRSVFDDLINSGVLEYMPHGSLKGDIFEIQVEIENYDNVWQNARDTWDDYLLPYHSKHINISALWDSIEQFKVPETAFENNMEAYVHNKEFANIIASRTRMQGNLMSAIQGTQRRWEALVEEIEEYLGEN